MTPMDREIEAAINFIISYLFNQLPRRRVNMFAEELEKILKTKFHGHWYPEAPEKGSGYRCIKTERNTYQADSTLKLAAYQSGLDVKDVLTLLPTEMTLWIDPNEVSYKMADGEIKILFNSRECKDEFLDSGSDDGELSGKFSNSGGRSDFYMNGYFPSSSSDGSASPTDSKFGGAIYKRGSPNQASGFIPRSNQQTFTTAAFAQTKFGSTKLKTNNKRGNRMSSVELSNHIKMRSQLQQYHPTPSLPLSPVSPPRSVSPRVRSFNDSGNYFFGPTTSNYGMYKGFGESRNQMYDPSGNGGIYSPMEDYSSKNLQATSALSQLFDQSLCLTPSFLGSDLPAGPNYPETHNQHQENLFENFPAGNRSSNNPFQQLLLAN